MSAGTNRDAEEALTDELVEWADCIFVMERAHLRKVRAKHRGALKDKRVIVLDIPDEYGFMDPRLIALLKAKMRRWLPEVAAGDSLQSQSCPDKFLVGRPRPR